MPRNCSNEKRDERWDQWLVRNLEALTGQKLAAMTPLDELNYLETLPPR